MSKAFTKDEARAFEQLLAGFADDAPACGAFRVQWRGMKMIKCDLCTRNVNPKDAYVSWWVDSNLKTSNVWLTCQPYDCAMTRKLQQPPKGLILMDHHAGVIAARFESWAKDYQVNEETVASIAVRISTLLATRKTDEDS